jgi:transcriptional regulator with XRE-family HTH domain
MRCTLASVNDTEQQPGTRAAERFAARLRDVRLALGVTQAQLAQRMRERGHAYVQQTIVKIEQGERVPRIGEAADLAASLGASLGQLTCDEDREDR